MEAKGTIVFIDDDEEDQLILKPILEKIIPECPVLVFTSAEEAIEFLRTTNERLFLIISEVTMPRMNGLELRRQIEQDTTLRKRAIPFIFFTHPVYKSLVEEAYDLTIQGFFEKKSSTSDIEKQLEAIVAYWSNCLHPNRFDD